MNREMKKKFLDKYFYLENNMDLINILYNSNPSLNLFEEVENLLFSDDELINNEGFDFFEFLNKFKPILLDNALEKYKYDNKNKITQQINETPKNYTQKITYLKNQINDVENLSKETFENMVNIKEFLYIMENYISYQKTDEKNKKQKINILEFYKYIASFNNKILYDNIDFEKTENINKEKRKYVKSNKFIKIISGQSEILTKQEEQNLRRCKHL